MQRLTTATIETVARFEAAGCSRKVRKAATFPRALLAFAPWSETFLGFHEGGEACESPELLSTEREGYFASWWRSSRWAAGRAGVEKAMDEFITPTIHHSIARPCHDFSRCEDRWFTPFRCLRAGKTRQQFGGEMRRII